MRFLTYKAGNRGVRYIFTKKGGDEAAPQFHPVSSDTPDRARHSAIFFTSTGATIGAELLEEVTNWPTYYPAGLERRRDRQRDAGH